MEASQAGGRHREVTVRARDFLGEHYLVVVGHKGTRSTHGGGIVVGIVVILINRSIGTVCRIGQE